MHHHAASCRPYARRHHDASTPFAGLTSPPTETAGGGCTRKPMLDPAPSINPAARRDAGPATPAVQVGDPVFVRLQCSTASSVGNPAAAPSAAVRATADRATGSRGQTPSPAARAIIAATVARIALISA